MGNPNVGPMAYFLDTEGNTHGLLRPLPISHIWFGRSERR
jgi:hypothetical protein